ncbi:hypothetical protein PHYBLDRAFT_66524 [Phycomyces blakesleeanus NRRL 1555(-)]|uniref:Uncharacterized protein n=1 Tax=Phycomyces blakesleeanus (strain ATCC 8743b / DSM 1359 / FGSC 10004 / NBRC 33097 / NRRL 1555) TaxID=763407 RepID=A0A162TUY7_PHYB8|nr:hypothetical protein PHYBLDRAFT_66524 [Phycomyces blakesleeanus NRRL 1555(-)]OAD71192.1 hypothetical protein PHYBLDRAFT_66524 [Phycomyces blakesleeanus NRRL 1555(-)]|eukprot:XP_018289232.1 hypothetical protein PHYBLDRAFT_66524 [Phycomyces blakesleeanus NRRL 1555(-)]
MESLETHTLSVLMNNMMVDGLILYLPPKEFAHDLAPVIVEIQNKVNHAFVARAIRYCLNIFDDHRWFLEERSFVIWHLTNRMPIHFTRILSRHRRNKFKYTLQIQLRNTLTAPIDPMIALACIFTLQEKSIVMLDEYDDPTIQDIYKTELNVFSFDKDTTNDLTRRTESFCDAMASQFVKILKYKKRLRQYAEDRIDFARQFKCWQLYTKSSSVTPIRATTPEKPSGDPTFVTNERAQSAGRFNWALCYEKGRAVGMFIRYSSHISLKQAFSRNTL